MAVKLSRYGMRPAPIGINNQVKIASGESFLHLTKSNRVLGVHVLLRGFERPWAMANINKYKIDKINGDPGGLSLGASLRARNRIRRDVPIYSLYLPARTEPDRFFETSAGPILPMSSQS